LTVPIDHLEYNPGSQAGVFLWLREDRVNRRVALPSATALRTIKLEFARSVERPIDPSTERKFARPRLRRFCRVTVRRGFIF